jgi:hypothetical protein
VGEGQVPLAGNFFHCFCLNNFDNLQTAGAALNGKDYWKRIYDFKRTPFALRIPAANGTPAAGAGNRP